jgi:hypothetical protein
MMGYFRILTAIPGFFLSALILMLLWNVIAPNVNLVKIDYVMAMLVNITLWLGVAPLVAAGQFRFWGIFGVVPGFFLSSVILMLLWGVIGPRIGLDDIDYPLAMLITITLWLAVGPLAFARFRFPWRR